MKSIKEATSINALVANSKGEILELPDFEMAARSGDLYREPLEEELMEWPKDAETAFLPQRRPILWNKRTRQLEVLKKDRSQIFAAAAILPIGNLRTLLPAAAPNSEGAFLPQWAYTAVGIQNGKWVSASLQIEKPGHPWENQHYNTLELNSKIQERLAKNPQNRVLKQLAHCAQNYHCNTAQNIFYERWEGALPVSPACNAQCIGCISLIPDQNPPSSHERISFSPTLEEILEVAIPHLEKSPDPLLSFGQGCEGEPLLASATLEKAIIAIRARTPRGTLNLNTNASLPESFLKLCRAGLDAVRISMNSAVKETYEAYYQPRGYGFEQVIQTAKIAHDEGLAVSINLLTFPGVTDREEEAEPLVQFIRETQIHAIQWRNLAIDPDQYLWALPKRKGEILGIPNLLKLLRQEFPKLHHLSFSRPKEFFTSQTLSKSFRDQ